MEKVPEQLERVVKNTAAAYDASVEINLTRATPPLVNNQNISNILKNSAVKLYGEEVVTKYEKLQVEKILHILHKLSQEHWHLLE